MGPSVHDHPGTPEPGHAPPSGAGAGGGVELEAALEIVRAVAGWYRQAITQERYSTAPDAAWMLQLLADLRACVADQQALEEAGPEDVARIAAAYKARYAELTRE